jgi:predicted nucleic acid-binding protein
MGRGVLLEPLVTDVTEWFAELDRDDPEPFMPDGRDPADHPATPGVLIRAVVRRRQERTPEANVQRLESFFAGPLELLPFEDEDARAAGEVRAALEARGTAIGAYDLLLAGQARRRGAILVTADTSELAQIDGPRWEDWASSG